MRMNWITLGLLTGTLMASGAALACEPLTAAGKKQGHFDASGKLCFTLPVVAENYVTAALSGATEAGLRRGEQPYRELLRHGPSEGNHQLLFSLPHQQTTTLHLSGKPNQPWSLSWRIEAATPLERRQTLAPVSPGLQRLSARLAAGENSEAFWRSIATQGTPLVEPYDAHHKRVTFLWRGDQRNVYLFGSPAGDQVPLFRLADSDVWFRSFVVPADTLMQYRFSPNIPAIPDSPLAQHRAILVNAQADPLNPRSGKPGSHDRWNHASLLDLTRQRDCTAAAMAHPLTEGTLTRSRFYSDRLDNGREIQIYRPHRPAAWTLMLFDGNVYQQEQHIVNVLDALIARRELPPVNLVLIDSLDLARRAQELTPNPVFADVMAQELRPWLIARGLPLHASHTILSGSSYGGLAAAWVALRYPQLFGNVLSLSGSYWWAPKGEPASWLTREYQRAPRQPIRFWLQAGTFESDGPDNGIYLNNLEFEQVLRSKGYPVSFHPTSSGHDYSGWCEALVTGLRHFSAPR